MNFGLVVGLCPSKSLRTPDLEGICCVLFEEQPRSTPGLEKVCFLNMELSHWPSVES